MAESNTSHPWGIGGNESGGDGTGGPQADVPADGDELGCHSTTRPWDSSSSGDGTGGPLASAPDDDDKLGCRFNVYPFGFGGDTGSSPTPTYYLLTECDTSATISTTGALTSNISSEVGNIVELAEYAGCWQVSTTTSPGIIQALTIAASHADCATCADAPVPCDSIPQTGGVPDEPFLESYYASPINIGAGTNWEDHNDSTSYGGATSEKHQWEWDGSEWEWQTVHGGPFGYAVSVSGGHEYVIGAGTSGDRVPFKNYTKAEMAAYLAGNWNAAPGRSIGDIEDGACVWAFTLGPWPENVATGVGGFVWIKTTGATPIGTYTLFMIHDDTDTGGSHAYSTLPQTSIELTES